MKYRVDDYSFIVDYNDITDQYTCRVKEFDICIRHYDEYTAITTAENTVFWELARMDVAPIPLVFKGDDDGK